MKKLLLVTIFTTLSFVTFAGGIMTNTNRTAHFLRNPARGASTEIDAVYTNPAGLSHLDNCGFNFTLNNQSAFQKRTITSTFAPYAGFGDSATKVYKSEIKSPFIPSFMAAYKTKRWVFSGGFAVGGGGGKAKFANGLPSFESGVAVIPALLNAGNPSSVPPTPSIPTNKYSADISMEGATAMYTGQLGATYAVCEVISVYAGAYLNIASNSYVGYMKNMMINPNMEGVHPLLGQKYKGQMVKASEFFTDMGQPVNAAKTADLDLDCKQTGMGVAPILGLNMKFNKLNVGLKYEFKTKMDIENKIADGKNAGGMFPDKAKTPNDIPAMFTVGAQYDILHNLTFSAGYHHYFDSKARMAEVKDPNDASKKVGKQTFIDGGMNEYLGGLEWRINEMFLVSGGIQFSTTAATDAYQTDMSHSLNSYSVGLGGAVNVTKNIRINAGYFFTNYEKWNKASENYWGTPLAGTDVFSRTNKTVGIGVDFSF